MTEILLTLVYLIGFMATWPVMAAAILKQTKKTYGSINDVNILACASYALGPTLLWPISLPVAVGILRD